MARSLVQYRLPSDYIPNNVTLFDSDAMSNRDNTVEAVRAILAQSLSLGARTAQLNAQSRLLGAVPELDSLAVVNILTAVEDRFGVIIHDDEISAQTFSTFGSLVEFIETKLQS